MHAKATTYKPYFLLFVFCLIAYLPLSSFVFSLKNDAFIYNFPNKFFFSECIRHGYLPTWNPYLNFGFPLFADPGFAWWNPITWVFGLAGYNAYTFTIEILFYIFLAGAGTFWLGQNFKINDKTRFALSAMFMCSGFFIGNLQHINFITCAAFIPWLTGAWLKYQQNDTLKNLLLCSLFGYLLFTGGHPAIPIAAVYYFLIITIGYFFTYRNEILLSHFLKRQLLFILFTAVLLSPLIYSYTAILPYYSRSAPVNQLLSTNVGFTLPSYISFFIPLGTIKNQDFFGTDVSMRNGYFSLFGIILFLYFLFNKYKEKSSKIFMIAGIIMLIISAGGPTKRMVYEHLPGFNFIKTNGEFRVFALFSFIICIAQPLDKIFLNEPLLTKRLNRVFKFLFYFLLFLTAIAFLFFAENISAPILSKEGIKKLLAEISFESTVKISLLLATFLSFCYYLVLYKSSTPKFLLVLISFDIILNSWLLLPITGVGKTSVGKMQSIINQSPKGFTIENLITDLSVSSITKEDESLIGNWSWYDKKIIHKAIDYPSQLLNKSQNIVQGKTNAHLPVSYLKNNRGMVKIISFTPNTIKVSANLSQPDTLILMQNYFPGWKAQTNEGKLKVFQYDLSFVAVAPKLGSQQITFSFSISH